MAKITDRDFDEMAKLANSAHASLAQWTAEGNTNRDSIDDVMDAEDALRSLCGAFRAYQARSNAMSSELKPKDEFMISGKAYKVAMVASPDYDDSITCILEPLDPQTDTVRVAVGYDEKQGLYAAWNPLPHTKPPFFVREITINPTTGEVVAPSAWVATLEFQLRATHNNIENMTNDQIRQALEVAIGTIPTAPSSEEVKDAEAATASDDAAARIEQLETALIPFARMHRDGVNSDDVACVRGVASDMTLITSRDFERAHEALTAGKRGVI